MECPLCGSRRVDRDYAPARSYAVIVVAVGILFAVAFLDPSLYSFRARAESGRIWVLGAALLVYGGYLTRRHGNRFCGDCGYRFRASSRHPSATPRPALRESLPDSGKASQKKAAKLDPNTPIEPILACLRFKDPQQRETAAATLRKLTGQDFDSAAETWEQWWAENKEAYRKARRGEKK